VLAGKLYGIPVVGTHAHSWVQAFSSEIEAFEAYASAMPDGCLFLVDTYNTLEGVRRAVEVGKALREQGHELIGIRLDSGDLAFLSIKAREILDQNGFSKASIVASNDLDEHIIASLKQQRSAITTWGVGTKLVTAYDQPALGGVYKLSAMRRDDGGWEHKVKLSEQTVKTTTPGILQVRRFRKPTEFIGDAIYDTSGQTPRKFIIVDPTDPIRRKHFKPASLHEDLLVPIFRRGKLVYTQPKLREVRAKVQEQLSMLHEGIKRLINPHEFPAGLEQNLHEMKTRLILQARGER
jgi:nicotinate phosphoribosyltransferase